MVPRQRFGRKQAFFQALPKQMHAKLERGGQEMQPFKAILEIWMGFGKVLICSFISSLRMVLCLARDGPKCAKFREHPFPGKTASVQRRAHHYEFLHKVPQAGESPLFGSIHYFLGLQKFYADRRTLCRMRQFCFTSQQKCATREERKPAFSKEFTTLSFNSGYSSKYLCKY
ncbi:uncharacterized protein NEMAJ01_1650 [Nematocida major]|uniref:uncharacterized protein n=1 Tax=Nematocida major TaxID=1912982 RepID=UPI002007264D|nr:uncharacterized protein NEMAJ01_1650 [Nematocida major]KAH9386754.1 hypothetical protein NEMAJ01_1650 [Nematocida major]